MSTTVSFPGIGIGEFSFDRVAFEIFGKEIYWYGVIIMLGMVAAFIHTLLRGKQEGVKSDDILDIGIFTVVFGVIGARLYYVLTTLDSGHYKTFIDVIAVWDGGLAIYGGIIAGCTALVITSIVKKINPLKIMDMAGPGVMIAQAIGRWGNFMNGEAFGYEVPEDSLLYPFRMGLISEYTNTGKEMHYYHPTFLYESLWNILGFVIISFVYRKKKFNGQMALMYFAWYGFGRMFIEGLRTDSLYVGPFRISQVVGAVCFIVGVALIVTGLILVRKGKLEKWLKVSWAEPALAAGVPVVEQKEEISEDAAVASDGEAGAGSEDIPTSDGDASIRESSPTETESTETMDQEQ